MSTLCSLQSRLIESLYCDALVLADEVRLGFDTARLELKQADATEEQLIAFSCEALRTANRMMQCLSWLMNHRAHNRGELTPIQLRRQGRMLDHFPPADERALALMPHDLQHIVAMTQRLYERVVRMDRAWRNPAEARKPASHNAVAKLRKRASTQLHAVAR